MTAKQERRTVILASQARKTRPDVHSDWRQDGRHTEHRLYLLRMINIFNTKLYVIQFIMI